MITLSLTLQDAKDILSVLQHDMITMKNLGLSNLYDQLSAAVPIREAEIELESARIKLKKAKKGKKK